MSIICFYFLAEARKFEPGIKLKSQAASIAEI